MKTGSGSGSLKIRTHLNVALQKFRDFPEQRQGQLQQFAGSVCNALNRQAPIVVIDTDKHPKVQFFAVNGQMVLGVTDSYIANVLKWEAELVKNGSAAVFGTVARACARTFGDKFKPQKNAITDLFTNKYHGVMSDILIDLVNQIATDVAAYTVSARGVEELLAEMPGLGDAVAASFISNALPDPELFGPHGFAEPDKFKRWGVIWSALVMELVGQGTEDSLYPSQEVQDIVRNAAEGIRYAKNQVEVADATANLRKLFLDEGQDEDEQPDMSKSGDAPATDGLKMEEGELACIGTAAPVPTDRQAGYEITARAHTPVVANSSIEQELKDALSDFRMESITGQASGELRQASRILTDQRVFGKRRKVLNPVSASVVVCVDTSGSMNGYRIHSATQIHDALCYALSAMEIRVFSCTYSGSRSIEYITPVNLPGEHVMTCRGIHSEGGNGDDAALSWAADILLDEQTERQAIVFLADGEFANSTVTSFHKRVKDLDVSVFHVDYINSPVSPFGGTSIHAGSKTLSQIATPLAAGLALALGLD